MTAYIIRRLVLMIPTLLGMTVMVFLIARLAPGRPGATQHEATQMSAEAQTAIREWYEKRYGLDLPLWRQYLRWWRGMIVVDAQAAAWTDEPAPRPVYTLRRNAPQYPHGISNSPPIERLPVLLVRGKDNRWLRLVGLRPTASPKVRILKQSDEQLSRRMDDHARGVPVEEEQDGRELRHAFLSGQLVRVDQEIPQRAVRRYRHDIQLFELTLGESQTSHTTVMAELKRRLPITLMISFIAFPLAFAIAIPCGMVMASRRGRGFDMGANLLLLGLWSIPIVLSATLLIGYTAVGGQGVAWFPNNGLSSVDSEAWPFFRWLADRLWHLVLPVGCIVYTGIAYLAKQMRAAMLDNITMDYVRTAKAKGLRSTDIMLHHVFRNSLLPLITILATIGPFLIAGSVIIEVIFNIEGMGLFFFRAVQNRDYDVVQALALVAGVLNLTGLLLADIAYAIADPRIAHK